MWLASPCRAQPLWNVGPKLADIFASETLQQPTANVRSRAAHYSHVCVCRRLLGAVCECFNIVLVGFGCVWC